MNLVNITSLLARVGRNTDLNLSETDMIEWAGEALSAIDANPQYEEAVCFVEVRDHKCLLPSGLQNIIQIARNRCFTEEPLTACPVAVVEEAEGEPVPLDCHGTPISTYELSYYRPYYDLIYEYQGWSGSTLYQSCYTPVRLADHTFFTAVVCQEDPKIYQSCTDEYKIMSPYIWFSFESGFVAIAYNKTKLDESGIPLIPDSYAYQEAITRYIRYRVAQLKFDRMEKGSDSYLIKAESDWHWYCKQAKMEQFKFNLDQNQNSLDRGSYYLPRQHSYYGFFGTLAAPEMRNWNRNNYRGYTGYSALYES